MVEGVIGPPPHCPRGAYFFFLEPPFLAAFFFAAISLIPPFGPGVDEEAPVNISGDKGLDILGVG